MAWWIKREENHMTPSAQEEVDLSRYDAWYIKTNLKGDEKPVFLTFDCGYENGYTASILDVLKKHKAPGAFFLCRHYIEDQPELVKRMKKKGISLGIILPIMFVCQKRIREKFVKKLQIMQIT